MELVLNNPFRVLGLPATASPRDIAKRISDLETFAELGKPKVYPNDFSELGTLDRSLEAIKDAARKIEQPEGRFFYSFFWFRAGDSVDELAFESLAAGNPVEAADLWDKQLGKKGTKKYTWRLNRAVLHLIRATSYEETLDVGEMDEALEYLGFVIDDDLNESVRDVLSGNEAGVDRESVWKRVVDELVAEIKTGSLNPYGKNAIRVVESFWSFPTMAREYVSSKIVNPLIDEVKEAIKVSEELLENDDLDALKQNNYLDSVEWIVKDLEEVLGEEDVRFQSIANEYANEVCACAIKALNDFDNPELSYRLIQWANELPSFSRVKARIEDNLETIEGWQDSDEKPGLFDEFFKKLDTEIGSFSQAETFLGEMRGMLVGIKNELGGNDETYIKASSACVHRLLGFLVKTVNSAQDSFKAKKCLLVDLQVTIGDAVALTKKLNVLDMDAATRERVGKNLDTIVGIENSLTRAMAANSYQASNSKNILEQIPGFVWVLGLVLLVAMCSGK